MISGTKRGDKGGYRNLLQINCQSEWGDGGSRDKNRKNQVNVIETQSNPYSPPPPPRRR